MPTHPSSPFSHAHIRPHHQPDSFPPGLTQWACYKKASAYGSRVGWTLVRRIHTYCSTEPDEYVNVKYGCLKSSYSFSDIIDVSSITVLHVWCACIDVLVLVQKCVILATVVTINSRVTPRVQFYYSTPQWSRCKRCTSYGNSICLSVCPSVTCRYCVKMTARSTVQFALSDSKMCLVL